MARMPNAEFDLACQRDLADLIALTLRSRLGAHSSAMAMRSSSAEAADSYIHITSVLAQRHTRYRRPLDIELRVALSSRPALAGNRYRQWEAFRKTVALQMATWERKHHIDFASDSQRDARVVIPGVSFD
jgi:hypothetical protein